MEWNGKRIMQQVQLYKNLEQPNILGIDGIHNLGITYLKVTREFMFQSEILQSKFSKADLKTVSVSKIPARTTCPVRLGTAIRIRHPLRQQFSSQSPTLAILICSTQFLYSGSPRRCDNHVTKHE
jgi:hypothetical protein